MFMKSWGSVVPTEDDSGWSRPGGRFSLLDEEDQQCSVPPHCTNKSEAGAGREYELENERKKKGMWQARTLALIIWKGFCQCATRARTEFFAYRRAGMQRHRECGGSR